MNLFDLLISLYAPSRCLSCKIDGNIVCSSCAEAELIEYPEVCYRCNKLSGGYKTCRSCRSQSQLLSVVVGYEYDGVAQDVVRHLKFKRVQSASKLIARYLYNQLPDKKWNVITHIPTSPKRIRQRGYDQARLIAREVSRLTEIPHETLLYRLDNTRQVGKKLALRKKQASEAFRTKRNSNYEHILVIDDVMASGATMESAANILRKSGAKRVDSAVFARS